MHNLRGRFMPRKSAKQCLIHGNSPAHHPTTHLDRISITVVACTTSYLNVVLNVKCPNKCRVYIFKSLNASFWSTAFRQQNFRGQSSCRSKIGGKSGEKTRAPVTGSPPHLASPPHPAPPPPHQHNSVMTTSRIDGNFKNLLENCIA